MEDVERSRRGGLLNINIKTYVEVCKLTETSTLSRLEQIMAIWSKTHRTRALYLKTPMEHHEVRVSDLPGIATSRR